MKVTWNEEQTTSNSKHRGGSGRKFGVMVVVACILCIIAVAGLSLIGHKTLEYERDDGYKSPYELADNFVTYTYQGDTEAIFKMQPRLFQARSIADNQMTYLLSEDDVAGAIANLKRPLANYMETLNAQHGQWNETHEVSEDMYAYTEEELADLQKTLRIQGVDKDYVNNISEAGIINVAVSIEASNGSGGYDHIVRVPVYKYGDYWYLGQRTGDVFLALVEGDYDPYGDLLNGFTVVGNLDDNGNEIYENEDGYMVYTDEETGRQYYEGDYGNKYYYDDNGYEGGSIAEVTGPDGGEPLTEETWEDYWDKYYEEQGLDIYSNYQYDEWGNTQYLDNDGNVTKTVGPDGGEPLTEETYDAYWSEHESEE